MQVLPGWHPNPFKTTKDRAKAQMTFICVAAIYPDPARQQATQSAPNNSTKHPDLAFQMIDTTQRCLGERVFFAALLLSAILFWRSPDLLTNPRFWAEEGKYYYANLQDQGLTDALTLVIRGNLQLLTNLIAYAATLVPAEYAAHVTTYLSFSFAIILAGLLAVLGHQNNWSPPVITLIIAAAALLPHGYEIYLSATNVQWICSACILILALLNEQDWSRSGKAAAYIFTGLCGLTGVCSVMLTPIFLARRFTAQSSLHFRLGLLLGACALLHIGVILASPHPDRMFTTDAFTLTFPIALQSVLSPLFGVTFVDWLLAFDEPKTRSLIVVAVYCLALLIAISTFTSARPMKNQSFVIAALTGAWIFISALNVFGSIGDTSALISGWGGGRYFFLGTACLLVSVGFATSNESPVIARSAIILLITIVLSGISQIYLGEWKNWLIAGESWKEQVARCLNARPCMVEAWPGGADWKFQLTRP